MSALASAIVTQLYSSSRVILRGGDSGGGADAGIYAIDLGRTRFDSNTDRGFRCVYRP